jgi:diguanylate cyclase (GGDEF)-like protein
MVKFLSEIDPLTNVYNRRYLLHTFPKFSVRIDRKDEKLILFFIDIDHFKMINDHYGHETGDEVLKQLSNILVRTTSKKDIVARLAGDEFIIMTPFIEEKGRDQIMNQINNELIKISEELNMDFSVSIGTSVYPNDAKTLDGLLNIADQNMYKQKSLKEINY